VVIVLDVVAIGELLVDFTCTGQDSLGFPVMAAHPGGAPANFLAVPAKFGSKTAFLGKIGDDAFGHLLHAALTNAGISTDGLVFDDTVFTTLAFVTLDDTGDRSFSFARKPGADTQLRFDELDLSLIEQSRIFHFGSLSLTHEPARTATRQAVAYAKSLGKLISFDPNLRLPLWADPDTAKAEILWGLEQADVVKLSDDEAEFLFGLDPAKGANHIRSCYGVKLVFVTCGANGCWFDNPLACGHVDAPCGIEVIDTTGAGDIFGGSAVARLLELEKPIGELTEADLAYIGKYAATAASLSTEAVGGIPSIPQKDAVLAVLNKL
jgi:fructokinase